MEHIGQYRSGGRIAVFENVGQIKADAPEICRIEAVLGVVQTPCKAAVFGFAPLGQPHIQAVGIGQIGNVLQQVAETPHVPVQVHQCVHSILYLLFLCCCQPAGFVLAADANQRVEKLAVGRGIGQLEGIKSGRYACFQCEVAAADGADENLHTPVQIKGEYVGGKAFGKGHQGALQGGFARAGSTQYQGVAGDFFTDVVVFGIGKVEVEVIHGFRNGLQRHHRAAVTQRIAVFFAVRVVVDAESAGKVFRGFREAARPVFAAGNLAEPCGRCGIACLHKAEAAGIEKGGIGFGAVTDGFGRRAAEYGQSRRVVAEHDFARHQPALRVL